MSHRNENNQFIAKTFDPQADCVKQNIQGEGTRSLVESTL